MKHNVEAPMDKVKELIIKEYPDYYRMSYTNKMLAIAEFVKPIHKHKMFDYMNKSEG